jgi:predicted transposase YdaD
VQNLPVTHDAFFRALMDEPGVAAALLREHLPAEVAALLAPNAPELLDAHFVAAHLRHSQADRLYRARALSGGEVYIYVLLEHKSAPDPEVGVQLLGYLAEIWRRLDRQRLEQGGAVGTERPPIVPLVIYHGAREWNVPLSFGETVAADPALRPYLPNFTYSLLDLGQVPDERLSSQRVARGGLRVLKYSHRPDGQGAAVLAAVDDLLGSGILVSAFIYINWAYDAVDRRAIEGALARAPDEQREAVMSVMAQEREQGRVEGRAEGRAEGEAQGKARGKAEGKAETLLRLLERRFHDVPETYRAQVLAADVEQLDAWIDAVLDAPSVDAIFGVPTAH